MRQIRGELGRQLRLLAEEIGLERARSGRRSVGLPRELWDRVVAVAREVGVNRTSRALGLWYYAVKKRVLEHQEKASDQASVPAVVGTNLPAVHFIELPASGLAPRQGCVIEMRRGDGASVTVTQAGVEHVAAVARSFLEVRP